jgi:hypothetical protein
VPPRFGATAGDPAFTCMPCHDRGEHLLLSRQPPSCTRQSSSSRNTACPGNGRHWLECSPTLTLVHRRALAQSCLGKTLLLGQGYLLSLQASLRELRRLVPEWQLRWKGPLLWRPWRALPLEHRTSL